MPDGSLWQRAQSVTSRSTSNDLACAFAARSPAVRTGAPCSREGRQVVSRDAPELVDDRVLLVDRDLRADRERERHRDDEGGVPARRLPRPDPGVADRLRLRAAQGGQEFELPDVSESLLGDEVEQLPAGGRVLAPGQGADPQPGVVEGADGVRFGKMVTATSPRLRGLTLRRGRGSTARSCSRTRPGAACER
jgi:hypothetical protein